MARRDGINVLDGGRTHSPPEMGGLPAPTKPPPKPSDAKQSVTRPNGQLPRFDQALRQAVNSKKEVVLSLAVPIKFDEGYEDVDVVEGRILEVDTYAIKILSTRPLGKFEVWISKAHIVATYIRSSDND